MSKIRVTTPLVSPTNWDSQDPNNPKVRIGLQYGYGQYPVRPAIHRVDGIGYILGKSGPVSVGRDPSRDLDWTYRKP